jgi:hypothetical protein
MPGVREREYERERACERESNMCDARQAHASTRKLVLADATELSTLRDQRCRRERLLVAAAFSY